MSYIIRWMTMSAFTCICDKCGETVEADFSKPNFNNIYKEYEHGIDLICQKCGHVNEFNWEDIEVDYK